MTNDIHVPISDMRLFKRTQVVLKTTEGWAEALSDAPRNKIQDLVQDFVQHGLTENQFDDLSQHIAQLTRLERNRLGMMIGQNFKAEQIHLFVTSDPSERQQLIDAWKQGMLKRAKQLATTAPSAIQTASTVLAAGGALAGLGFIGMSLITQDANMADTGKTILGALADPQLGLDSTGWVHPTMAGLIERAPEVSAGLALLLMSAKAASAVIGELTKDNPQEVIAKTKRDLQDRVTGVFHRTSEMQYPTVRGMVTADNVNEHLNAVDDAYLPLLTHLEPKELVTFLTADDDGRAEMMRVNPPAPEQKIDTVRALHEGTCAGLGKRLDNH